jgi:hypothetical protein
VARIRTIKPEFWTDSLMVRLPPLVRLIFLGLVSNADDHGCLPDEPERLAMEIMPREDPLAVDEAIQVLIATQRIEWLVSEDDGYSYFRIAKWAEHQKVDHPAKSRISREGSRKMAIPNETRRQVATKYNCDAGGEVEANCYYCGASGSVHWFKDYQGRPTNWVVFPGLELDHLEAECLGGKNSHENIVLACRSCNRGKGTKAWFEFFLSRNLSNPRETSRSLAPDLGPSNLDHGPRTMDQVPSTLDHAAPNVADASHLSHPHSKKDLIEKAGGVNVKGEKPPRHGAISRDKKFIYFAKGTPEFEAYAADFREVNGCDPEVNASGGRWFDMLGQFLQKGTC